MLKHRVIPCLLFSNGGLVKTKRFTKPQYIGDPINAVKVFNDKEVDELIFLDIDASKKQQVPNYALIEEIASECFMPLCYGGGITTLEEAQKIFALGVEKVALQSALLRDTTLIADIVDQYGSQSVVASVDIKKDWRGRYRLYSAFTQKRLKKDWIVHIAELVTAGVGEILLCSVDHEGMGKGLDLLLIKQVASQVSVPLIVTGGVGSLNDIAQGVAAGADAVAVGTFFVLNGPHRAVLISYPQYEALEDLLNQI